MFRLQRRLLSTSEVGSLARKIDNLATVVENGFERVNKRFEEVDKRFEGMENRFEGMEKRFEEMENRFGGDVAAIKTDLNIIKSTNQFLVESNCRQAVARMFGERFSRPFLMKSIMDVPSLYKRENVEYPFEEREKYQTILLTSVQKLFPSFYGTFANVANKKGHTFPAFDELVQSDGTINKPKVALIGKNLSNIHGRHGYGAGAVAQRIYDLFVTYSTLDELLDSLKNSSSPGLAIAIWDALGAKDTFLTEMELDCRGQINIIPAPKSHYSISVGEIKTDSSAIKKAKDQLAIRLKLLRWAVERTHVPGEFLLIGRVFVLKGKLKEEATLDDGISFYTHKL